MITLPLQLLRLLPFPCGGHRQLALENLALHQQLAVYKRTVPRPKLRTTDRLFWLARARVWAGWRLPLVIVTPTPFCGGSGAGSVSTGDLLPDFAPLRMRGSGSGPPPAPYADHRRDGACVERLLAHRRVPMWGGVSGWGTPLDAELEPHTASLN